MQNKDKHLALTLPAAWNTYTTTSLFWNQRPGPTQEMEVAIFKAITDLGRACNKRKKKNVMRFPAIFRLPFS